MKPSGLYVLQVFDIFQRNKKSERRPHRNEVRISQLWWKIQDLNSEANLLSRAIVSRFVLICPLSRTQRELTLRD